MAKNSAQLPISVVIVARNEAANLPRCLESVQDWVSEIIVALNETTDESEAVAKNLGATVHHVSWQGYRDTKNAAVTLAHEKWILALDADEEISPTLKREIADFFSRCDATRYAGARCARKVWFLGRWITHGDWYPDYNLRLFNRDQGQWGGDAIVHEKVEVTGPVATLKGDLHHYSFPTLGSHVAKINPFADLFVRQKREEGRGFSLIPAVIRPIWRFFRGYVIKLGFLDGFPGLYIAVATAFGAFVRYSRLYEEQAAKPPDPHSSR